MKLVHALHNICFFSRKKHTILFMFLDSSSEVIIFQATRTNGQPLNFFVCVALFSRFSAIIRDESSNLIPVFFLNSCFCFIFFLIYILMMTFHIFFFLFVKKCPGGECISVSDFFPVVFCSIGFPIEKHKKFRSKEKNCYYFLLLFRSMKFFFFRNSIHLSSFFSLGFLFFL